MPAAEDRDAKVKTKVWPRRERTPLWRSPKAVNQRDQDPTVRWGAQRLNVFSKMVHMVGDDCRACIQKWSRAVALAWLTSPLCVMALEPMGPLPARNFQPLRQTFLHLPFAAARTLGLGEVRLSLETAESNIIATDRGAVDAVLKFEQNRTSVRASVGAPRGFQLGIEMPFLSRFGGFLDPVIDSTEKLFSAFNPERRLFPNNSFGGFWVRRDRQTLFHGPRQYLELGDVAFEGQKVVWAGKNGTRLATRLAIEVPLGRPSAVWGSGTWDLGGGLALDAPLWTNQLWLFANIGGVFPLGRVTAARLPVEPFVVEGVAFEWLAGRRWSVFLQQHLYTSPFRDLHSAVLEGTVVELAAGLGYRRGRMMAWIGGIDNVSGVAQAADFTLILGCAMSISSVLDPLRGRPANTLPHLEQEAP